tara:strand:+ start:13176 stop:13502 length:327 start_codon:yes stop_codon:yes gene_type:complete
MGFNDFMERASETFLGIVKEDVELVGKGIIEGSVDTVSFAQFMRLGGKSSGAEFVVFVRKADFTSIAGKKGDRIRARGYSAVIKRQSDNGDGQFELVCESPNMGSINI